jgi:hypothetical protein
MRGGGIPFPGLRTVKILNPPLIQDWIVPRGPERRSEQIMTMVSDIEIVILVGVWFALNLSLIQDWMATKSRDPGIDR